MSTSNSILNKENDIIEYLEENLNFFQDKDGLVEKLILEHPAGIAVSLIERQVNILRKQNTQLTNQLNDLFSIAKDNEKSTQKMHNLTLSLISCQYLHEASALLESQLVKEFSVDFAAVKLLSVGNAVLDSESALRLDENSPQAKELKKLIHKREPVCGFFELLDFSKLNKEDLKSMAVMPLFVDKNNCFGALILASVDKEHFSPDSGTLFLKNLGEVVSYSFVKYL
jgi:uncharacterized protein